MSGPSVKLMSLVSGLPIFTRQDKDILTVLADHSKSFADEEAYCFPSQAYIASKVGLSTRHVRRRLIKLEEMKVMRRQRLKGETDHSQLGYLLNLKFLINVQACLNARREEIRSVYVAKGFQRRSDAWLPEWQAFCRHEREALYDTGVPEDLVPQSWQEERNCDLA